MNIYFYSNENLLSKKILTIVENALKNEWVLYDYQFPQRMLSFIKENSRINIYVTKMTISICHDLYKKSKTPQNFIKNIEIETLNEIFKNPKEY